MIENRLREFRTERKLTLQAAADAIGTTTTTIQRLETGETPLVHEMLEQLAAFYGVNWIDILQPSAKPTSGFSESAAPFKAPPRHALANIKLGPSQSLVEAKTDELDRIGIFKGDVLVQDVSSRAVRNVQTGDTVIAQVYGPGLTEAITVMREYVAPSLLITNSRAQNRPNIDLDVHDAAIKAVCVQRFGVVRKPR